MRTYEPITNRYKLITNQLQTNYERVDDGDDDGDDSFFKFSSGNHVFATCNSKLN